MKTDNKHYHFINSETGNTLYYHTVNSNLSQDETKAELDRVKAQVAIRNALFVGVIYWEEAKAEN